MPPDLWTLALAEALLFAILAALGLVIHRRTSNPGSRHWVAANTLAAFAMLAAMLPSPGIFAIDLLFAGAMLMSVEGNRSFRGLRAENWWLRAAAGAAVAAAAYYESEHNPNLQIFSMSLFAALSAIAGAATLMADPERTRNLGSRFTTWMFLFVGLASVTHAVHVLFTPLSSDETVFTGRTSWSGAGFIFIATLLFLCCSIGWLMMSYERSMLELVENEARARSVAEKAAAADQAKAEFLAIVGHEIRNPLAAVLNLTELILSTELTREQKEYELGVRASLEALLRVSEDLLDLSRIESGRLKIERIPFDIVALVEGITKVFRHTAAQKGLELIVASDSAQQAPRWLRGDAARIRQVLTNLIGNAIKFTKEGQIRVALRCFALSGGEAGVRISVTDTGVGIPRETVTTVFENSGTAHASTAAAYGGSGIGLHISKRLIEIMGGRLVVESEVGKGSTFWFELTFPISTPAADASASIT